MYYADKYDLFNTEPLQILSTKQHMTGEFKFNNI